LGHMGEDLLFDLLARESTEIGSAVKRSKVARVVVAIMNNGGCLGELKVVVSAKDCIFVGSSSGAEVTEIESELEADKADVCWATVGDVSILSGLEDFWIPRYRGCVHGFASRVVEGDNIEVAHVQPMLVEMVHEIELETSDGGGRVEIHPKVVKIDITASEKFLRAFLRGRLREL
jgi:hypothetical protein